MATGTREYSYSGDTTYSALTRTAWSNDLHKQVQDKLYFHRKGFIGPDQGEEDALDSPVAWYPILQKTELGREGGDKIILPLLRQLSTDLFASGNTAVKDTTYEQAMDFWTFNVWIELIRTGTGWQHKMSPQRNKFHSKKAASQLLTDALAQKMDESIFDAFYNKWSDHIIAEVGQTSTAHPNSFFGGDAADEDSLDASDVFNTEVLERMAVWAEENNINPIKLNGGEQGFVCIVHPRQMHTLRQDTAWINAQQHANVRGMKNPIFSGSEGMWNGIYIHVTNQVQTPPATVAGYENKRRAILMGAHAVARAIGQRPEIIKRDDTDYGRLAMWVIDVIFGDARADWTSDDDATPANRTVENQSSSIWTTYAANVNP